MSVPESRTFPAPPPGWYVDPDDAMILRWWDGTQWSWGTMPRPTGIMPLDPPLSFTEAESCDEPRKPLWSFTQPRAYQWIVAGFLVLGFVLFMTGRW